jgi:predicted RNA-binding protein with PUA domain
VVESALKNMPRESMISLLGLKPFIEYGKLVIDLINKIAGDEKRKEIIFREEEVLNHDKWLARMRKIKDGDFWIYLRAAAFDAIHAVHDARVKAIIDKASQEFKKSHVKETEEEIYEKNWKILQNLFKGDN